MKGKFITFEGSEGCGKSTQSKMLAAYLKKRGLSVVYVREPGGTQISEQIRRILLDTKNDAMAQESEMLLYMAARSQIVKEIILPALKKGKVVISDRFLDSTLAYQGYGLGMNLDFIRQVGKFVSMGIKPNLTIFLDLPVKKGLKHRKFCEDRIEKRSLDYHGRVREGYLKLARLEPARIKVVSVEQEKAKTQSKIRDLLEKYVI